MSVVECTKGKLTLAINLVKAPKGEYIQHSLSLLEESGALNHLCPYIQRAHDDRLDFEIQDGDTRVLLSSIAATLAPLLSSITEDIILMDANLHEHQLILTAHRV